MSGSDPGKLISKADNLTTLSLTRWSADWESATRLYERAANGFRVSKDYENAKLAFEKASKGREMLSSYPLLLAQTIAKSMESAAALAKELRNWTEVIDFYRKASELYMQCHRPQFASDSLAKAARAVEDALPNDAIKLYSDACVLLEDDRKEQMALDLYHAVTNIYVKLEKYTDAVAFLLKLGLAADKCNATNSQYKHNNLSSDIWVLIAVKHDSPATENNLPSISFLSPEEEREVNQLSIHFTLMTWDTFVFTITKLWIDAFLRSDQNRFAGKLLSAYKEGDVEEIKRAAQSRSITNLDSVIIKLARKLPTGDVAAFKTNAAIGEGEALDENDLT
ncbi:gamma-soluble NSF attachment protein-like [Gossypium australe]|uniref:Gamma-soluble NSF attachment protein n=1 Tax=Gossypium australe TaxID=47621 RepID=A0A5B6X8C9_9ROSI|nr:gamma-soluble NSF attachment protein-like [Gossypium australe]